ncbi:hypothetical protein EYZ11_005308 [Aspergillus tanneri]|uniref:Uncharacterized protein n=1 Tax=Aspergillus tanneri TaxID=1220188 RepID=A0A4S3JP78_9EURO|nr:hypothetical protein EYZ11_005308 [Aspergillus tanneri]
MLAINGLQKIAQQETVSAVVNLEAIKACSAQYILEVLQKNPTNILAWYSSHMEDCYDKNFDRYADAVMDSSTKAVENLMLANGDK